MNSIWQMQRNENLKELFSVIPVPPEMLFIKFHIGIDSFQFIKIQEQQSRNWGVRHR